MQIGIPLPWYDFNPRAHEGHDENTNTIDSNFQFQSTCPRGARHEVDIDMICDGISIHVPTRGTTYIVPRGRRQKDFNPRAHEGHDFMEILQLLQIYNFNPRAHEGHDPNTPTNNIYGKISIHVPTRGTT